MSESIKAIYENHSEIVRYYEEPSYNFVVNNKRDHELSDFIKESEENRKDSLLKIQGISIKSNFTLLGLVNAYDLDKRCNVSKKVAVAELYGAIKINAKRKETSARLEEDYQNFIKSQAN